MSAALDMLARGLATHAADSLVEGSLVAAIAGALLYLFRRSSAAARHGVLLAALAMTATLPLLRAAAGYVEGSGVSVSLRLGASWALALVLAWSVVASILMARVAWGVWRLRQLRQRCRELPDAQLGAEFAAAARRLCPARAVAVLASDEVQVPAAIGLLRPAVVFPAWMLHEVPSAELHQVVVHELAHLRRWDDWTNLFQKLAGALFFFHPAVWWMERRLSLEREMACDDAVVAQSGSATAYAECLLRIAEHGLLRRGVALAQAALGRVSQFSARVARLLQLRGAAPAPLCRRTVALVTVLVTAGLGALWRAPLLVSFSGSAPAPVTIASSAASSFTAPMMTPREINTREINSGVIPQAHQAVFHPRRAPLAKPARPQTTRPARLVQTKFNPASDYEVLVVVVRSDNNGAVLHFAVWRIDSAPRAPVRKTT